MLITNREELKKYTTEHRLWQGIPSIEVTERGRIFLAFYSGGTAEGEGNYCILIRSDNGQDYSEPIAVSCPKPLARCYDPCLWIDPMGRLWFWWAQSPDNAVRAVICDDPDAMELSWSEEFPIGRDVMMNKPTVLRGGEWLFPVAVWSKKVPIVHWEPTFKPADRLAFVYRSEDRGKTFVRLGGADVPHRSFDEHMILEQSDGTLAMYVRTDYGIGVSYSYDRGLHWGKGRDSGLGGPCSRFHIRRLSSGKILLINHLNYTGRNNLHALLSDDDGNTWKWKLLLDARSYVSYPDVSEREGYLYITYDRERGCFQKSLKAAYASAREILVSKITEEDIMQGKIVSPDSYLAHVASKLGKYCDEESNPYLEIRDPSPDSVAASLLTACPRDEIIQKILEAYPTSCVNMHTLNSDALDTLIEAFEAKKGDDTETLKRIITLIRGTKEAYEVSPIIRSACNHIKKHITEELSVNKIAAGIGVSRYYLSHLFKRETGSTVTEYLENMRISMAKDMLTKSSESIGQIALSCGFSNASYFTKRFSASEGMSPKEYRRQQASD